MKIKNLLFPGSFTSTSVSALPWVISLAEKYGATVHFLHVMDDLGRFNKGYVPIPRMESWRQEMENAARQTLENFCAEHLKGCPSFTKSLRVGEPAKEIISYIFDNNIDLVVMASHGREGMERYLLGSITEKVLRKSPAPVLVVTPELQSVWQKQSKEE